MRNISFALTWERPLGGSKTVTRRLGWARLRPGTLLMAYRKSPEARDRVERYGPLRVLSVRRERLDAIDAADVAREGFPELSPAEFVAFFCREMKCDSGTDVTRIEFERVEDL